MSPTAGDRGSPAQDTRIFERYLAGVAALGCVVFTVLIWADFSGVQPMWPLPALYLIEVAVLSVVAALAFILYGSQGRCLSWAANGMLTAFSILGLFSVGALYFPTVLLLAIVCITADLRNRSNILLHLGLFLLAGLVQAALMLSVSSVL